MNTQSSTPPVVEVFVAPENDPQALIPQISGERLTPEFLAAGTKSQLAIVVHVKPQPGLHAVKVVVEKENFKGFDPRLTLEDGTKCFFNKVDLEGLGSNRVKAVPGKNNLRVAIVTATGMLYYWEAFVVAQDGRLFMDKQLKCVGQLALKGDTLSCDANPRSGLLRLLEKFGDMLDGVPETFVATYREPVCPDLTEGKGWVKWSDESRQVACIMVCVNGEVIPVKCAWQHMPVREDTRGRRRLVAQELVWVNKIQGMPAKRNSEFAHEVDGPIALVIQAGPRPAGRNMAELGVPRSSRL